MFVSAVIEMADGVHSQLPNSHPDRPMSFARSSLAYDPGIDGMHAHNAISVIPLKRFGLIELAYIKFKTFIPSSHDDRFGEYGPLRMA
jgi:hypothetical protein